MWPIRDPGPMTDAFSLTSDWDNQWLTAVWTEVIAEAHLDQASIFAGIQRFAQARKNAWAAAGVTRGSEVRVDALN